MKEYKAIFDGVESTLIRQSALSEEKIRQALEEFKHLEGKDFSDEDFYWKCVYVVFYAGYPAEIVNKRLTTIHHHFPSYKTVAGYTESDITRIMNDVGMIRFEAKITACIQNAKIFSDIVAEYGSFQSYIEFFAPRKSRGNLELLEKDLQKSFKRFGKTTVNHFLTDIGMPVLKPESCMSYIQTTWFD